MSKIKKFVVVLLIILSCCVFTMFIGTVASLVETDTAEVAMVKSMEKTIPTQTPTTEPTATKKPQPTKDIAAVYRKEVLIIGDNYMWAFDTMSTRMSEAGQSPILLVNEDWMASIAEALAMIIICGEDVRELNPPANLVPVHESLLAAAAYYDEAVPLVAYGINNLDAVSLAEATELLQLGNLELDTATSLLP